MANTEDMSQISHQAALQVAQQAIAALVKWAKPNEQLPWQSEDEQELKSVTRAKEIFKWTGTMPIGALRLLFNLVQLREDAGQSEEYWHPMQAIADTDPTIPYPSSKEPDTDAQAEFKEQIQTEVVPVLRNQANWNNLALLSLILEKYGSCLSFGENNVALVDLTRITGSVAAALADNPEASHLSLVAGDLSGIQKFIYTISSEGALKSLRARSFYLELVTEEIVQQLLKVLELPRTSIIYAGGGNLFVLAPQTIDEKIQTVAQKINHWLNKEFQSKVFLALSHEACLVEEATGSTFRETWNKVIQKLNRQKTAKFKGQLSTLLEPRHSFEPCRVCYRDDEVNLNLLNGEVLACPTCIQMFELGGKLFNIHSMVRSHQETISGAEEEYTICLEIGNQPEDKIYYHLFKGRKPLVNNPEQVLLINNWFIDDYKFQHFQGKTTPLLLGNYFQRGEDGFMRAIEFAEVAHSSGCIARVGYLRMDVDRLGQIFAQGLRNHYSLPRLAGLSRQMSYFFKVYLNSLAEHRKENFLDYKDKLRFESLTDSDRPNLLFIYAGGDDLFVSGAWNEVVEFAFDVYQSFRAYTGYNPDITLSGGISIDDIKFPLYQSAEASGEAENLAKGNGRDSLGMLKTLFKWKQWLGGTEAQTVQELISELGDRTRNRLDEKDKPGWLGILPFVRLLHNELKGNYSRSFVRNLLITADFQEQAIREKQNQIDQIKKDQFNSSNNPEVSKLENEREEIRYYLHLPKIAYTLARLPEHLRKEDTFRPIRTSLKSPYNAPYFRAIATWIELLHRN